MSDEVRSGKRIESLDQFRGYTILAMIAVNVAGHFKIVPDAFKHLHTHFGFADSIMPQFLFAVGFAYRLTFLRRLTLDGPRTAYVRAVRRCLALALLAVVIHRLDGGVQSWDELCRLGWYGVISEGFQRDPFAPLMHIALASLWALPVLAARPAVRIAYLVASATLFAVLSDNFYYDWVMTRPGIDGGRLAFLTWVVPLLAGTLAYDVVVAEAGRRSASIRLFLLGGLVMLLGYALSCLNTMTAPNTPSGVWVEYLVEPPFFPPSRSVNAWTMSQRAGSVTYVVFGTGFSLAVYAMFLLAVDSWGYRLGLFATFGRNALIAYLLHDLVADAVKPYAPEDAPAWFALAVIATVVLVTWVFLRGLEEQKTFVRL